MRVDTFVVVMALQMTLAIVATSASAQQFRLEKLHVPGRVLGVKAEDLDGDKRRDLVVVFAVVNGTERQRALAVFFDHFDGRNGSFPPEPDLTLVMPKNATFIDVGDVDGDGKQAIVFGDRRGVMALRLEATGRKLDPTPRRLVDAPGLLVLADEDELPFMDLLRDWDGDGKQELLLPMIDSTALFARGPNGWSRVADLKLHPFADYAVRSELYEPRLRNFAARVTFTLPELVSADFDGDGKPDLCAVAEDLLQVHKGGGPTIFSPVPVARISPGVRTPQEQARGIGHIHITVRDLDGDGIADLAVNKIVGGLGQMRAQTGFYYGKRGGGFDRPAQVIDREGYAGSLGFGDLDGDGKPELVMPHVSVGLGEMARALLSKRMTVGWEARRNLGRQFSVVPETVKEVDFPVDFSTLADIEGPYPSVAGDFNGDGKVDFVAATGSDAMGVWLGGGSSLIADSPKAIVHVTPTKHYFVSDLDGDKKADLIFFYRSPKNDALVGSILVARNTGRGW
jgi:hypothetical protein